MSLTRIPKVNLPPLSTTSKLVTRRSKNPLYARTGLEWYWKLSPALPMLWIRDIHDVSSEVVAELEEAWHLYSTLHIPGKGDGGSLRCFLRSRRRQLEVEYAALDNRTRRAMEVALATCGKGFCIRGMDGSLDYCTDVQEKEEKGL